MSKSLRIRTFIPVNLLNNPQASCFLINFDFFISLTGNFDKSITLAFLVFVTFGFLYSVFFLHFKQEDNNVSYIV